MSKPVSSLRNMILAMTIVSGLSALVLSYTYQATKKPIEDAQDAKKLEAIAEILPDNYDNNPYENRITISGSNVELYPARQGNIITSVALKTYSNNAFSGRLELIVGFLLDGTITDYRIISHKETPGLGSKITEEKFARQLRGFNIEKRKLKVKQDSGDVDAVTAATISSRAVLDAISRAYESYNKFSTLGNKKNDE